MSNRMALAISIALTLVLATSIVGARDRLFVAEPAAGQSSVTSAVSGASTSERSKLAVGEVGSAPRIIEIPLSTAQEQTLRSANNGDEQVRGDDDESGRGDYTDTGGYEEEDDD